MIVLAFYLLKVVVCSGLLFLYYHFFLRNRFFHQWNRFYLLLAVVASILLPLIKIDLFTNDHSSNEVIQYILIGQSTDQYLDEFIVTNKKTIDTETWAMIGYSLISIAFVFLLLASIYKVVSIIRSHTVNLFHTIKLIHTSEKAAPFSFLNYVFWHRDISLQTETGQQIFQHELVHVNEKHTWDKLFMQLVIAVFWCNPFFWLIRKELRFIHEFIADKKAVGDAGTEALAAMILQSVYPQQFQSITNQFFQKSIKRRIFMLTQTKNPKVAYAGRVIVLPLLALLVLSFTLRTNDKVSKLPSFELDVTMLTDTVPKKEKDIQTVDVNATKKEIKITYKNGKVETLTEQQARQKGLLNNYDNSQNNYVGAKVAPPKGLQLKSNGPTPLFIVDGKEISKEAMETLDPNSIEAINVYKGESATAIYGEKGTNGVIEIKMKKPGANESKSGKPGAQNSINLNTDANTTTNTNKNSDQNKDITVIGLKKELKSQTGLTEVVVVGHSLNKNEPVFEKAEFTPSIDKDEWRAFLQKSMVPIIEHAANNNLPRGNYTVQVRFIVEKDGSLSDISVLNDPGFGIAGKVLEMMKSAPKWKPAIQNQHVVRSYHTQPITFQIEDSAPNEVTLNKIKETKN